MLFLLLLWVTGHMSPSHQLAIEGFLLDDDITDQVTQRVRAAEADGYDIAAFYGPSLASGEHKHLTKRDVEDHAAHPSTESRNFELRLTSGERLRMSLQKRSAMSPDVTVVERAFGREELRRPQVRDCFFSGGLEGVEGHASLSLCDGYVIGGIHAKDRDFELQSLPETSSRMRRGETEPLLVLATWSKAIRQQEGNEYQSPPEIHSEVNLKDDDEDNEQFTNLMIEVGVYLDREFLAKIKERFGINTTQHLTDLVALKWSGLAALMSNPSLVGWKIEFQVVHLEIWREIPIWYSDSRTSMGKRMQMICRHTSREPFDNVMLETANAKPSNILGITFMNSMCNPYSRCAIVKGANLNHWLEAHETGHNMGLHHENNIPECHNTGVAGFVGYEETIFKECYAKVLNRTLRDKKCLFHRNVDTSKYNKVKVAPLYRGQLFGFDGQCRLAKGEGFSYLHIPSTNMCRNFNCIRKSLVPEQVQMSAFLGTPCGKEKMCLYDACVPWLNSMNAKHLRSLEVENHWGPWSEFSPCEGTCGVAVSVSTRKCNTSPPYLSPYCHGDDIKAQLCSSRPPCYGESRVVYELLKQQANDICSKVKASGAFPQPFTGKGHVRHTTGEVNRCTVTCKLVTGHLSTSFLLRDGTPCNHHEIFDVNANATHLSWRCVRGRCFAFGCNGKSLGEGGGVNKDKCGVCGGDGSSCFEVSLPHWTP